MAFRRFRLVLPLLLLVTARASFCAGQGGSEPRLQRAAGSAGIHQLVPGAWGMVGFEVVNPSEEEVEVLVALHFAEREDQQYGRRLWIPGRTRRTAWFPVFTPADIPADKGHIAVGIQLMRRSGDRDVLIESPNGRRFHDALLSVRHVRPVTGILADADDRGPRDLLAAVRAARDLPIVVANLRGDPYPPNLQTLDALDTLLLATDDIANDPVAVRAIRRWVYEGGRLWIMLDEVSPDTVAALLGESFRTQVVDRVDLTSVVLDNVRRRTPQAVGPKRDFEEPVELVRVFAPGLDEVHRVGDWPVSFWKQVGRGQVLMTTLGPYGWLRERTKDDPRPTSGLKASTYLATTPLEQLAAEFMQPRSEPVLPESELETYVAEQVGGFRIVSRGRVIGVLGGFCAALLVVGLVLAGRQRLELLGWIGPGLAVCAALVLAVWGRSARTAMPDTTVAGQLVEVAPGVGDIHISGVMALYTQDPLNQSLGGDSGGYLLPNLDGIAGETRRLVWTDSDRWRWENLQLPAGMRVAQIGEARSMDGEDRLRATLTFGPDGVSGQLSPGPLTAIGDMLLATPARRQMTVDRGEDGAFTAVPDDVLPRGQFFGDAVLSDEQRRRQAIYTQLFGRPAPPRYPAQPTLLAWSAPLELGLQLPESAQHIGSALVSVPLEIERPAAGTKIIVPAPFLPYAAVAPPGEIAPSTTYNKDKDEWLSPLTTGSRVLLRFQIPKELLPFFVDEARLTLKINAPGRKLEILGLANGQLTTIAEQQSPVGQFEFTIDTPEHLRVDDQGGLYVGILVGKIVGEETAGISQVGWQVDDAWLELTGEVVE